ncbi:MAG: hypothetical protein V3R82_03995 [Candidatus Hydrothermarchaeales archaeon]
MKGQVSLEAVLVAGFAIVVLLSLTNIAIERKDFARDVGESGEIKMLGELFATAINNVYANSEGFRIYLGPEYLNYTYLGSNTGGDPGLALPIKINTTSRVIILRKNMSITSADWTTTVPIIPTNIVVNNPTADYPETTIRNDGTNIIIHAAAANMETVP